ncbi:MAG: CPBP family intramembrane metalloprotease [Gemmatales bacterium]|nr:CPBP family intramembrane metalloprotease [Gemmatales bacterium]MDW8385874.1 type II CAAX endopeptidase family protein [Gemmatales bacterium]
MAFVWSLAFLGIQFVVVLFIAMAITMGFVLTKGSAGLRAGQEALKEPVAMLILGTVSVLAAVLVITGLALRGRFRRALAIRLPTLTHVVLVCLLAPPLYLLVLQVAVLAMQVMPEIGLLEELEETVTSAPYDIVLLAGAVIPGVSEEIFCRGFLGRGLVARWGVVPGILLTSLFFGLIHVEPVQICYAAFIGVVLHVVFLTSKSLLAPMLLHALNNAIAFSPTALGETLPQLSQVMNRWEENGALPPAVLISTVFAVVTLLVLFWQTQVRWFRSDGEAWDPGYVTAEIPPKQVQPQARSSSPKLWAFLLAAAAYLGFVVVMLHQFDLLPGL